VDDGIATGATARAACRAVRARGAARIVLATPVGDVPGATPRLRRRGRVLPRLRADPRRRGRGPARAGERGPGAVL